MKTYSFCFFKKSKTLSKDLSITSSSTSPSSSNSESSSSGNDVGRVPVVVWASAAEGLLEILEQDISLIEYRQQHPQNENHSSSAALDPATYIAVASAATIAALASLLKFPCDRALMRLNRVLKCRTKRGFKNREEREVLFKLIDEINPSSRHQRPRTSELFDNVNPLIFAEWEKIFARCCEEAMRAPSISMQRLRMTGDCVTVCCCFVVQALLTTTWYTDFEVDLCSGHKLPHSTVCD